MNKLNINQIKEEFKQLKRDYFSTLDKSALTSLFVKSSTMYLHLSNLYLSDNNYQNKELQMILNELEIITDNLYLDATNLRTRLL